MELRRRLDRAPRPDLRRPLQPSNLPRSATAVKVEGDAEHAGRQPSGWKAPEPCQGVRQTPLGQHLAQVPVRREERTGKTAFGVSRCGRKPAAPPGKKFGDSRKPAPEGWASAEKNNEKMKEKEKKKAQSSSRRDSSFKSAEKGEEKREGEEEGTEPCRGQHALQGPQASARQLLGPGGARIGQGPEAADVPLGDNFA